MEISRGELGKLPYLDPAAVGDRVVNLMPLWDGSSWHCWLPGPSGLVKVKVIDLIQDDYVAKEPARESDLFVPFVDFMWQRASWREISPVITTIEDDFHCLAASVAKLRHIHRTRLMLGKQVPSAFAATEMEYIAIVARGVFDLLQEAISLMWNGRVRLLDNDAEMRRKGRGLPRHFSRLVLTKTESQRTAEDISVRFGLPPTLAAEYARHAPFFCELLSVRNRVVHGLGSKPTVFTTEKGFCVNPKAPPFKGFEGWSEQHRYNQNLVSLLPWLSHVILHTIDACSQLMSAFASQIQFPPEIAPGYRVFVRSEHNEGVIGLLKCRSGELVWWEDSTPASPALRACP